MKVIAGIVTYNPDIIRLKENILSLVNLKDFEEIIIVDNNSNNLEEIKKVISQIDYSFTLISNERNYGIAKALNQMLEHAYQNNIEWVLTCDQDSIMPVNLMSEFTKYLNYPNIAIICPTVYDLNSQKKDKISQFSVPKNEIISDQIIEVYRCITSGALTNVSAWKAIGGFDELLFIDSVDFDFCHRLYMKKFKMLQINSVIIKHEIGKAEVKKLLNIPILVQNYSPFRKYYIIRNRVYCDYKYFGKIKNTSFLSILRIFLITLIYENNKISKLKSIFNGFRDGICEGKKLKEQKLNHENK